MDIHKDIFYEKLNRYYLVNKNARKPWNYDEMNKVAQEILLAKQTSGKKTRRQYHLLSLYDTLEVGHKQVIIKKTLEDNENIMYFTPYEELFDILYCLHISIGHGSRDKMIFGLKSEYHISRPVIELFLSSCEVCQLKKAKKHANIVTKPIISREFCSRAQIDLIDYQSCQDGDYKWLLNYQDHLTKFSCLRPLKSNQRIEVASELLKIFLEFGAPAILQSDNGRDFVNSVITELEKLWPELKIIHGGPRHPQSQGSIEHCNQYVENMMRAWMLDHKSTNWSIGCYFVQFQKNCSLNTVIGRSPYKALFGTNPKIGLSSTTLPNEVVKSLHTEEDLNEILSKFPEIEHKEKPDYHDIDLNDTTPEEQDQKPLEIFLDLEKQVDIQRSEEAIYTGNSLQESNVKIEVIDESANSSAAFEPLTDLYENIMETQEVVLCVNCKNDRNVSCVLCSNQTSIARDRNECHLEQKRAAEEMLTNTAKKMPPLKIGDCVLLSVGKIDRGPSDIQNLLCTIVDYKNGVFELGTAVGKINGWYNRADIVTADSKFLNIAHVPDKYISVQEAVAAVSLRHGQGYKGCSCKPSKKQCQTNRCVCFKKKNMCNSRCHHSITCLNE